MAFLASMTCLKIRQVSTLSGNLAGKFAGG